MSPNLALSTSLVLISLGPALPDTAAYGCAATMTQEMSFMGRTETSKLELPDQIYVVDAGRSQIRRAVPEERRYEDVCGMAAPKCKLTITDRRIQLKGYKVAESGMKIWVAFDLDPTSGVGSHQLRTSLAGGGYVDETSTLRCKPGTAPAY